MADLVSEWPGENFTARRRRGARDRRAAVSLFQPPTVTNPSRRMPAEADSVRDLAHRWPSVFTQIFGIAIVFTLWIGWLKRDDNGLTAVSGIGYWLGIAGSGLMLLLLLYPLRKRVRSFRVIGTVTFWFRTHMILGILGPVLILWHANFRLGSVNSSVALVTTVVVAVSGIVGRYLHRKIHVGMYGHKAETQDVVAHADELRGFIGADAPVADHMVAQLNAFTQLAANVPKGVLGGFALLPVIGWRGAALRMHLLAHARRAIATEAKRRRRSRQMQREQLAGVTQFVMWHIRAVKKAASFTFYERLFRLWHFFHVPLFILLVIVAIIHVFASHFY
jgi:hypothetical protein